jgi:hypothetical protein
MRAAKGLREKIGFMWVVTFHALFIDIVFLRVYDPHLCPSIAWIGEIAVTSYAEVSAAIDWKLFRIVRVVEVRAVAIFTFNHPMIGGQILFDVFIVAFFTPASLFTLVFYREGFPVVDIAQPIKIVSKALAMYTKIRRDHHEPHDAYQDDCPDRHPERSQYMAFHHRLML